MSKKVKVIALSPLTYKDKTIERGQDVEIDEEAATVLERMGHVKIAPVMPKKEAPEKPGKEDK